MKTTDHEDRLLKRLNLIENIEYWLVELRYYRLNYDMFQRPEHILWDSSKEDSELKLEDVDFG